MSFLDQLKSQARALQDQQGLQQQDLAQRLADTERACETTWRYLSDLARQLNVIGPDGPVLALDKRQPWPTLHLVDFRADVRRKRLVDREVCDYIALTWLIQPKVGAPQAASVSVNFPPDLERVTRQLACGQIRHERVEIRHPGNNSLQAVRFDYSTQAKAGIQVTADHERAELGFRLANLGGFEVREVRYAARQVDSTLLDELARLVLGQAGNF
ncbi:MAG: hypothetical protein JOY84_17595 [Curvibacter sp.]|nr:hypothetical protein [Curvibacter sp.]